MKYKLMTQKGAMEAYSQAYGVRVVSWGFKWPLWLVYCGDDPEHWVTSPFMSPKTIYYTTRYKLQKMFAKFHRQKES